MELRRRRRALGWTQQQLAELAGVCRQTVVALESGRQRPRIDLALRLAALLGGSVDGLFGDASAPVAEFDAVRRRHLLDNLRRTPLQRLQRLGGHARGVASLRDAYVASQARPRRA